MRRFGIVVAMSLVAARPAAANCDVSSSVTAWPPSEFNPDAIPGLKNDRCSELKINLTNTLDTDVEWHLEVKRVDFGTDHYSSMLHPHETTTGTYSGCTSSGNAPTGEYQITANLFPKDCDKPTSDEAAKAEQKRNEDAAKIEQKRKDAEAAKAKADRDAEDKREADAQAKRDEADRKAAAEEAKRQALHDKYETEQQTAAAQRDQQAATYTAMAQSLASMPNNSNAAATGTYRHLEVGFAYLQMPIYTDLTGSDVAGGDRAETGEGLGLGPVVRGDYFPWFRPWWSIGIHGAFAAGSTPLAGGITYVLDTEVGLKGRIGHDSGPHLLWEVDLGLRGGGWTADAGAGIIDATESGSSFDSYQRIGAGLGLCSEEESENHDFCHVGWRLELLYDQIGNLGGGTIYRVERYWRGAAFVHLELAPSYPRAGTSIMTDANPDDKTGFLVNVGAGVSWDFFSGNNQPGTSQPARGR